MPRANPGSTGGIAVGQRFGLLVAVQQEPTLERRGIKRLRRYVMWRFRCECGGEVVTPATSVLSGNTRSCGCRNNAARHGHTRERRFSPEYSCWMAMRTRCRNEKSVSYPRYGGRGITVCTRWEESFEAFLADMGPKPTPGHSIERLNSRDHYAPGNCRWATSHDQARNTRRTIFVEREGRRACLKDVCSELGVPYARVVQRLRLGWPMDRALSEPRHPGRWGL